jgi:hypothetical protein
MYRDRKGDGHGKDKKAEDAGNQNVVSAENEEESDGEDDGDLFAQSYVEGSEREMS